MPKNYSSLNVVVINDISDTATIPSASGDYIENLSKTGKLNEKTDCVQTSNSDIPKSHQSFLPLWPISNQVWCYHHILYIILFAFYSSI